MTKQNKTLCASNSVELSSEFDMDPLSCPFCGYVNIEEPNFPCSGVGIFGLCDGIEGAAYCNVCSTGFFVELETYDPDTKKAKLYFIEEFVVGWLLNLKSEKKLDYETVKKINNEFFYLDVCDYTTDPSEYLALSTCRFSEMSEEEYEKYGRHYNNNYDKDFIKFHNLTKKYCLTYRNTMDCDGYINDITLFNLGRGVNSYCETEEISTSEHACYVKIRDSEENSMVKYHYGK